MERLDIEAITKHWLNQCGSCDVGLPTTCTCPDDDPREVILALVRHLEKIYNNHTLLLASTMGEALDELETLRECQDALWAIRYAASKGSSVGSGEIAKLIPPRLLKKSDQQS